ncbi:3-oxoacyl-[acyl-carrier protein] reductase [Flavobacterium resistens]|uniref:3-oxoacyl-[acyl-carrier protein] reductase n=1 Tax=Flavobacterium resistens TaxID=443612 RepID=A0A521DTZ7_9FLAO|nr:SDR family oxidoreductase [Flavobacterium resistens]MRX68165.1 SDR family oxidoreductase [Flavobacterium resistens]SMO75177.1 3-oxoacyl-[acyl-carrier protein] reductase [Flavobacterium resistens]
MKTALITGGTKGIGKAIAERLLQEGWNVILTYFNDEDSANQVRENLAVLYPVADIVVLKVDCGNLDNVDEIENFLVKNDIYLDAILFNAGATDRNSFGNITQENWQRVFDVNVNFPTFLLQKIISRVTNEGAIIFTGSLMGIHPHAVSLSYGVTKAAVHALVKNLVKLLSPQKIRVNAVAPGFVNTEWQKSKSEEQKENINKKIALRRFCEPYELTDAYWFLISNNYMNGEILVVDGGYSLE